MIAAKPRKVITPIPFESMELGESLFIEGVTKTTVSNRLFQWRYDNRDHKKYKKFAITETVLGCLVVRVR